MEIVKSSFNSIDLENGKLIFNNHEVYVIIDNDNNIWFKAKDICDEFEYVRSRDAIKSNVFDEDKIKYEDIDKSGLKQPLKNIHPQTIFINEAGLYSLILASKKSNARNFKKWVTSDVLPSIRKNSEYKIKNYYENKLNKIDQLRLDLEKNNQHLRDDIQDLKDQNKDLIHKTDVLNNQNKDLMIKYDNFKEKYDNDIENLKTHYRSQKLELKKNNKKISKKLDKIESQNNDLTNQISTLNEEINKKSITIEKKQNRIIELVSKLENNIIQSTDPNKKPMLLILYFQDSGNYKIVRGQKKRINSVKKQYQDTSQVFYCAYEPNPITFFDTLRTESIQENKLIFSGTNHFQLAEDYSQEEFLEDLEILGMTRLD